jgi:hypothetical protein
MRITTGLISWRLLRRSRPGWAASKSQICKAGRRLPCAAADFKNDVASLQSGKRNDIVDKRIRITRPRTAVEVSDGIEGLALFHARPFYACPCTRVGSCSTWLSVTGLMIGAEQVMR